MKRTLLITLSIVVVCSMVSASTLTFKQALERANAHAFALKKAVATAESANAAYRASAADRWPTLSVTGTAYQIDDVPTIQLAPGLSRELGTKGTYQTDVRLNYPLYAGGRISSGIDLARAAQELQSALAKGDSDRIALTVWNEYLGLERAGELVLAAEASLRRAQIINDDVLSLFSAGTADSVDINEAFLSLSRAQLGLSQAMVQRRSSEIRLAIVVDEKISDSISLVSQLIEPDLGIVQDAASSNLQRSELRASEANVNANQARVRLARSDFLPTVSAFGGYSGGKPNQDFFNNKYRDYWVGGINLNWSFNLGGRTSARRKAARYDLISSQYERDRVAEQLDRDSRLAVEQVKLMYDRFQNAHKEFQIATDQYRLAKDRHSNGDLSSNRLFDIEAALTAAQSSLAASTADYWIAVAAWYFATGSEKLQEGF